MSTPQNSFEPFPNPQKHIRVPKSKKLTQKLSQNQIDPQIKSKSNIRIDENKQNENCSTT